MTELTPQSRKALFISHATPEDNPFVRWLGAKLGAMGYEVWADVMKLHGGIDWSRELESVLRTRAVKMLVVCTPSGLSKQGVRNEIEIGTELSRRLLDEAFIIPLRLEAYEAPFRIAHSQYIDFQNGWARGLGELTVLLSDMGIPRGEQAPLHEWLTSHMDGASRLQEKPEPLVSNWLDLHKVPGRVYYCEPIVGSPIDRFQNRQFHFWPCVPHSGGVITFARPDECGIMGLDLPAKEISSIDTGTFLNSGWMSLGIDEFQARRIYADIGSQAFDRYCRQRGMSGYMGSGRRLSWWGDIKTAPLGQVRFDWNFRRGARKIIGHSPKRNVHWHYAISLAIRVSPLPHVRLAARLVFSENGIDPILDKNRAHSLRRSLAKGWRNPRWRDMLCAYLWWIADGQSELRLSVAAKEFLAAALPPMQFSCPVSVPEVDNEDLDEEDPDIPPDVWDEQQPEGAEE